MCFAIENNPAKLNFAAQAQHFKPMNPPVPTAKTAWEENSGLFRTMADKLGRLLLRVLQLAKLYAIYPNISFVRVHSVGFVRKTFQLAWGRPWETTAICVGTTRRLVVLKSPFDPHNFLFRSSGVAQ